MPTPILGVNGIRLLPPVTGVGRVTEAIVNSLVELGHPFGEIRVYTPAPLGATVTLPDSVRTVVMSSRLTAAAWEQLVLPLAHRRAGPLLCPSYVAPLLTLAPTLLVHHGSYEHYPAAFPWWQRNKARVAYGLSAHRATRVVTVSEHSRLSMSRAYRIDPERITVIPEGVDTRVFRPHDSASESSTWRERALGADSPFLLYVGKATRRRNLPNLIAAFAQLKREGLEHKLVFIGAELSDPALRTPIADAGMEGEVHSVQVTSHAEVALAYNAAAALIYPSSYEGFGMPVLEAIACGTPAIALDNTAFPEFAAGVARLLPDAEPETLRTAIADVVGDPGERERVRRLGPERAKAYDWRVIAKRYLELLRELAGL